MGYHTPDSNKGMPKKIEGVIFTEVLPQLVRGIDTADLVRLGSIVRKLNRSAVYEPLTDSLRKIQWVGLMMFEAVSIEQDIASQVEPSTIVSYPYGQVKHSLAVTDSIIHMKSALDSMAVFLKSFLGLKVPDKECDFKLGRFRLKVSNANTRLGQVMKELEPWFEKLQDIRDEWIHRSSIRNMLMQQQSDVGVLPIPRKNLDAGLRAFDMPITKEHFWSTSDFLNHNYASLTKLFSEIVKCCIEIELKSVSEPIPIDVEVEKRLAVFPFKLLRDSQITKIKAKVGPLGF